MNKSRDLTIGDGVMLQSPNAHRSLNTTEIIFAPQKLSLYLMETPQQQWYKAIAPQTSVEKVKFWNSARPFPHWSFKFQSTMWYLSANEYTAEKRQISNSSLR